jgi:putative Holliday junction resolvase
MTIKTYLGFDVGTKRTGIAIANSLTSKANGIEVVIHNKDGSTNWNQLDTVINQHAPDVFIVGLPLDKENKEQEMTFIAKSFGKKLEKRFNISVFFIDEYLSSSEAKNQLKWHYAHKNADRGDVDKRSAELILQTWLNETTHD